MKSKVFSIFLVLVFVFFILLSPCDAFQKKDKERIEGLMSKIEEIKAMLDYHINDNQKELPLKAYLRQMIRSKKDHAIPSDDFKLVKEGEGHPSDVVLTEEEAIKNHVWGLIGKNVKFITHKISYEETSIDEDHDVKAQVTLRYRYRESPDQIGEMEFTLFHMKICIWW